MTIYAPDLVTLQKGVNIGPGGGSSWYAAVMLTMAAVLAQHSRMKHMTLWVLLQSGMQECACFYLPWQL